METQPQDRQTSPLYRTPPSASVSEPAVRSPFEVPAAWPFSRCAWRLFTRNQVLSRRLGRTLKAAR